MFQLCLVTRTTPFPAEIKWVELIHLEVGGVCVTFQEENTSVSGVILSTALMRDDSAALRRVQLRLKHVYHNSGNPTPSHRLGDMAAVKLGYAHIPSLIAQIPCFARTGFVCLHISM